MASVRYYKKFSPDTAIQLPDGRYLEKFKVAFPGDVVGYFATNSDFLQGYFADLMRKGRYAISEISWDEFNANYLEKKNQPQRPAWREELGRTSEGLSLPQEPAARLASEGRQNAVAVNGCDQPGKPACAVTMAEAPVAAAARQAMTNQSIATALHTKEFTPPTGGRSKPKRASAVRTPPAPPTTPAATE